METWLMFKQQLSNWWFHFLLSILALDDYPNWGVDGTISITRWVWLWTRCCRVSPHAGYQVVGSCVKDFIGGKPVVMAELILGQLFFWGMIRNLWFCHEIKFVISDYSHDQSMKCGYILTISDQNFSRVPRVTIAGFGLPFRRRRRSKSARQRDQAHMDDDAVKYSI